MKTRQDSKDRQSGFMVFLAVALSVLIVVGLGLSVWSAFGSGFVRSEAATEVVSGCLVTEKSDSLGQFSKVLTDDCGSFRVQEGSSVESSIVEGRSYSFEVESGSRFTSTIVGVR